MLKNALIAAAFAAALAVPAASWAQAAAPVGNAAAGEKKTQMCAGCHGIVGWRTAYPEVYKVPKIGGQHAAYIVKALAEYKNGERTHPSMRAIAASLSEQDMADLAAYYSAGAPVTASK
jgi:cytochrome c553